WRGPRSGGPRPRVQSRTERVEGAVVGGQRESGEPDGCPEELAALVEHALLDDLVCPQQQRLRDREPESLGGLEVEGERKARRPLDRNLRRWRATQDLDRERSGLGIHRHHLRPVGNQAAVLLITGERDERRQTMARCERHYLLAPRIENPRRQQNHASRTVTPLT